MASYFVENQSQVILPLSLRNASPTQSLRRAQIGAIHAIAAHFSLGQSEAALVVMPTGSGKTGVMMLAPFLLEAERVLVITPSHLVRRQIFREMSSLTVLRKSEVISDAVADPSVLLVDHRRTTPALWEELRLVDIVVTIPTCISPSYADVVPPPQDLFDLILVDEAHHLPAKTWEAVIASFPNARKILFTATPFRRDEKQIEGSFAFTYPISEAVKDGIFSTIEYLAVESPEPDNQAENDRAIARAAERVFQRDRADGYPHALMVRTDEKQRADELGRIYQDVTQLNLKVIHSGIDSDEIDQTIEYLFSGTIDGIICVDMLGEGFDFPRLKIAAIHAPHKSLSATLQFIGRFARRAAENLGPATFVAVPNDITIESQKLYEEHAAWQTIVPGLLDRGVDEARKAQRVVRSYRTVNDYLSGDSAKEVSLFALKPYFHVRVYELQGEANLRPNFSFDDGSVFVDYQLSSDPASAMFVTETKTHPRWITMRVLEGLEYNLFLVYWSNNRRFLFICTSQRDNDALYDQLKNAFAPHGTKRISEKTAKRALRGLTGHSFNMIGLRNSLFRTRAESYRGMAGPLANRSIQPTDSRLYLLGNSFGTALDNGVKVTIGWSGSGKIWSNTSGRIHEFYEWCEKLSERMSSDDPVVTDTEIDNLKIGEVVQEIPEGVVSADWDVEVYQRTMRVKFKNVHGQEQHGDLLDFEITVDHEATDTDKVCLSIDGPGLHLPLEYSLFAGGTFVFPSGDPYEVQVQRGKYRMPLIDYLNSYPLVFFLWNFSHLRGEVHYQNDIQGWTSFAPDRIEIVDWDQQKVDIQQEFVKYGNDADPKRELAERDACVSRGEDAPLLSIHAHVLERLHAEVCQVVYYDHDQHEAADFISVKEIDEVVLFTFYHCKKSSKSFVGKRTEDIYEVSCQVEKSVRWVYGIELLFEKMMKRLTSNPHRFIIGDIDEFQRLLQLSRKKPARYRIAIVQPGISKGGLPQDHGSVLAAADDYVVRIGCEKLLILASP